jgi:decaprenylphospho-beta-D-erythro-pentofuranosid-2-ulose 2-reductase
MKDALGQVQSVLLLGGTSDIGQAVVRRLLLNRPGARAVLASRRPESASPFAEELRRAGVTVELVRFDADETGAHRSVVELAAAGGDLDVVVLAWGLLGAAQDELDEEPGASAALARTNYVGAVSAAGEAARVLRRQGHGALVYLSSVAGERVRKANYVYGSSKAGADAFMQGLADSLVGSGVRVVVVRPGFVRSKMTAGLPAAPLSSTPEQVAEATVKGLGGVRPTVWVPGVLRYVFMIFRHLPRVLWRRMPM